MDMFGVYIHNIRIILRAINAGELHFRNRNELLHRVYLLISASVCSY